MVLSTAGGNTGNGNRGALIYNGADTTATSATALVLGDIGTFDGKIIVNSTTGGVVRATNSNSFGTVAQDTHIGNTGGGSGDHQQWRR